MTSIMDFQNMMFLKSPINHSLQRAYNTTSEFPTCSIIIVDLIHVFILDLKKNAEPFFKVGMNEMPVRPTHGDMSTGHANSGAGLLTLLRVGTIVTK